MNNIKNLLIAILTGLLALSLFTQPAQSATPTVTTAQFNALQARVKVLESNALDPVNTYDAVKLIQYDNCLKFYSPDEYIGRRSLGMSSLPMVYDINLAACRIYKP